MAMRGSQMPLEQENKRWMVCDGRPGALNCSQPQNEKREKAQKTDLLQGSGDVVLLVGNF